MDNGKIFVILQSENEIQPISCYQYFVCTEGIGQINKIS